MGEIKAVNFPRSDDQSARLSAIVPESVDAKRREYDVGAMNRIACEEPGDGQILQRQESCCWLTLIGPFDTSATIPILISTEFDQG